MYEIEWSCVQTAMAMEPASGVKILQIGYSAHAQALDDYAITSCSDVQGSTVGRNVQAILFLLSRGQPAHGRMDKLRVLGSALQLVQSQASSQKPPPAWICTSHTQAVGGTSSGDCSHAGLWGLGRVYRTEVGSLAVCTVDAGGTRDDLRGVATICSSSNLRLPYGSVRALQLGPSVEPEAAMVMARLRVGHSRLRGG